MILLKLLNDCYSSMFSKMVLYTLLNALLRPYTPVETITISNDSLACQTNNWNMQLSFYNTSNKLEKTNRKLNTSFYTR